jgi:hypothetical protein
MKITNPAWRKIGSAYMLRDDYSTIYVKRLNSRFHLITRNPNPIQGGWLTLGIYRTLRDAQAEGRNLIGGTS